jgi:hypothetical protein
VVVDVANLFILGTTDCPDGPGLNRFYSVSSFYSSSKLFQSTPDPMASENPRFFLALPLNSSVTAGIINAAPSMEAHE